jgi:1,2-phenylacetyl-CoA epoxidase catalytic subunit
MALVATLVVTIYLATEIEILDLKNIKQNTANYLRRILENILQTFSYHIVSWVLNFISYLTKTESIIPDS